MNEALWTSFLKRTNNFKNHENVFIILGLGDRPTARVPGHRTQGPAPWVTEPGLRSLGPGPINRAPAGQIFEK